MALFHAAVASPQLGENDVPPRSSKNGRQLVGDDAASTRNNTSPQQSDKASPASNGGGWDEEEVEDSGAIAVAAPSSSSMMDALALAASSGAMSSSSSIASATSTSASSPSSSLPFGLSPSCLQRRMSATSSPLLQSPSLGSPSHERHDHQPLTYLQLAGALAAGQAAPPPPAHGHGSGGPATATSAFPAFVPRTPLRNGSSYGDADEFRVAFGQSRERLQLFEQRLNGTEGAAANAPEEGTSPSTTSSTPSKKRALSEGKESEHDGKRRKKGAKTTAKNKGGKKINKAKTDEPSDDKAMEKPEGGFTFMQGTYYILKREHRFMTAKEIVAIGQREGTSLWRAGSLSP